MSEAPSAGIDDVARGGRGAVDDAGNSLDDLARTAPQNRSPNWNVTRADYYYGRLCLAIPD